MIARLPLVLVFTTVLIGSLALLNRADAQARDTIRKHHLEDIERSLYFIRGLAGTYPPYDQPTWCGRLNDPANTAVRAQVEAALRAQNEQYANYTKPFPRDPAGDPHDYFYWKRSPAIFELYAILEADTNQERNSLGCAGAPPLYYDYGIASTTREDRVSFRP